MASKIQVDVREHSASTQDYPAWNAIVTTRHGLCYHVTYAGDKPSVEKVESAWAEDRKAFLPWNSCR